MKSFFFGLLLITIMLGCRITKDEPAAKPQATEQPTKAPLKPQGKAGGVLALADFEMDIPADWTQEKPSSAMRTVQMALNRHPEVKVVGFYFGKEAGSKEANIERWKKEFSEVGSFKTSEVTDFGINWSIIKGTFKKKPFPMAQKFEEVPGYITHGVIVPSADGPYFFKLNGPEEIVKQESGNMSSFINSYRKK